MVQVRRRIFNLITGLYRPTSGTIQLMGEDITDLVTHKRVQKGIARTFQNIRLFKQLTVLENVKVAYHNNMSYGFIFPVFLELKNTGKKKMKSIKKLKKS